LNDSGKNEKLVPIPIDTRFSIPNPTHGPDVVNTIFCQMNLTWTIVVIM